MNQRLYQKKGETMDIVLSTHFTYRKLLRFVFPSLATMIFLSTYSIIDGFFVSNYVGDIAFAAINLIFPVIMIFGCVGSVIGAGGSALIGKRLGEGREVEARGLFSSLPLASFFMGCIMSICAWVFMPWMVEVMGAQGQILTDSVFWPYTACFLSFALDPAHISGILRYRGKPVSQLLNECGLRHD